MGDRKRRDLTELAAPLYFVAMGIEALALQRRRSSEQSAGVYEWKDTLASLTMGSASLVVPLISPTIFSKLNPVKSKLGRAVLGAAALAGVVSVVADRRAERIERDDDPRHWPPLTSLPASAPSSERKIGGVAAATALCLGGVALTAWWSTTLTTENLFKRRLAADLGRGPLGFTAALIGWDFIYYWNHRFMHTSRYMWAMHVVHHSSERYNLSTALRQPVAEPFTTPVPFGALCLLGVRPEHVATARGINLLWQFWIHTETVRSMGKSEAVLNSPSAHRVHHGVNQQYLDRNHGGILITWDRLFGTFEVEDEPVVYGLTKNINSFNPVVIAGHEYVDMIKDMASAPTWRDRMMTLLGSPGGADRNATTSASALVPIEA